MFQLFFFELHVLAFGDFKSLDDLVTRNFAVLGTHFRIVNALMVRRVKQVKVNVGVAFVFGVDRLDFKRYEPEAKLPSPARAELRARLGLLLAFGRLYISL